MPHFLVKSILIPQTKYLLSNKHNKEILTSLDVEIRFHKCLFMFISIVSINIYNIYNQPSLPLLKLNIKKSQETLDIKN